MKKILISSKLKEVDILKKLQSITEFFISKNKLAKGDELVVGVNDQPDGSIIVELDASLMSPEDYKSAKKEFLQIGKIVSSDLKNFDDDSKNPEEAPKSEETPKEEKQNAVDENSVKPAIQVHDTKELLFNKDENMTENLQSLLFSDEELKVAPETPKEEPKTHDAPKPEERAEKPEEPKDEKTPENPDSQVKTHDEKKPEDNPDKTPEEKPEEKKDEPETKTFDSLYFSEEEIKTPETKTFDSLYFSEDEIKDSEVKTFDSLYFSEEEIKTPEEPKDDKKPEEKPKEEKPEEKKEEHHDVEPAPAAKKSLEETLKEYEKTKKPYTKEAVASECGCSVEEVTKKMKELKLMDKDGVLAVDPATNPEVKKDAPEKAETPADKVETLKNLARLNKEAKAGRQLTFVEKQFCNAASKMFSEDEIAQAEKEAAEVDSKRVGESKMDMVRRLNKENGNKSLAQYCKETANKK